MSPNLVALKLCLEGMGIFDWENPDELLVHGAMYLASQRQVNLGYNFKLYPAGVLAPNLGQDYADLMVEHVLEPNATDDKELINPLRETIEEIKKLLIVPFAVSLTKTQWVQLKAHIWFISHSAEYSQLSHP